MKRRKHNAAVEIVRWLSSAPSPETTFSEHVLGSEAIVEALAGLTEPKLAELLAKCGIENVYVKAPGAGFVPPGAPGS